MLLIYCMYVHIDIDCNSGDVLTNSWSVKLQTGQPKVKTEWPRGKALDTLHPTATGLDLVPAWFLRLGAPAVYKPLTYLFNKSIATSTVPLQWKNAIISPVPKISSPKHCNDYRPISVTPVLTRTMERMVVRTFMYPALLTPTAGVDVL